MKKFFLIIMIFATTSCVVYRSDSKIDGFSNMKDLVWEYKPLVNERQFTKENIIKAFGTPSEKLKVDEKDVLAYRMIVNKTYNSGLFFVLPFKFENKNNILDYSFEFENNLLKNIKYQDVVTNVYAIGLMWPPYLRHEKKWGVKPWFVYGCSDEHKRISLSTPHMNEKSTKKTSLCHTDKLFGADSNGSVFFDEYNRKDGYTKMLVVNSIMYKSKIIDNSRKSFDNFAYNSMFAKELDRLTDISKRRERIKTKDVDCDLYIGTSKDPKATNRGDNPYLLFEAVAAICYSKIPDMVISIENSNRYPEKMKDKVDTLGEVKAIIETIRVN